MKRLIICVTFVLASLLIGIGTATADPMPEAPVASPMENQRAQEHFNTNLGTAMSVGGITGTIIGAGIGCAIGLPAAVVGCIPGAITGAAIGGVVGTIVVGGPTLAYSAIDLIQTWQAPPGTTKWNY